MLRSSGICLLVTLALLGGLSSCSGGGDTESEAQVGSGGTTVESGGSTSNVTGTAGLLEGQGGSPSSGGAEGDFGGAPGSGGTATDVTIGAGGSTPSAGGDAPSSGGTITGSGGDAPSSGGTITGSGGDAPSFGGSEAQGGAGTGGGTVVDPATNAAIDACMAQLPYGAPALSAAEREPIVNAIVSVCAEFAPPGPEWQTYCQMFLVAAINAESSYDTQAGTDGAGLDPSVGLLQIRFSATVRDFVDFGPIDAMERVGCDFGTVTSSDSYATKKDMMVDVNCNIALATWYIFTFGSGNGGSKVVWVYEYCRGGGVAGSLHIGMASYLMGADAAHQSLEGADFYYNEIKDWFDPCVTYSGTHPFELPIEPDVRKYCG